MHEVVLKVMVFQACCSRNWIGLHYVTEDEMYQLHQKVLLGLEAGGKWPSELFEHPAVVGV